MLLLVWMLVTVYAMLRSSRQVFITCVTLLNAICFQWFDAVGWVNGRVANPPGLTQSLRVLTSGLGAPG